MNFEDTDGIIVCPNWLDLVVAGRQSILFSNCDCSLAHAAWNLFSSSVNFHKEHQTTWKGTFNWQNVDHNQRQVSK